MDRVVRFVVIVLALVALAYIVNYFSRLVIYIVLGLVLAYAMRPIVDRAQGLGLGQILAILVAFVVLIGVVTLFFTFFVPFIAAQMRDLSQQISLETISTIAASIEARLARVAPIKEGAIIGGATTLFETLFQEERITSMMSSAVDVFTNLFYAVIVVPFVSFFFLKDGTRIRKNLLGYVPNRYFEIALSVIEKIETNLGRYFKALSLQCLAIGIVASVLLEIAGLDYALAVGVFTGLANTIPYFGPFMGFLAGSLVGIAQTGDFSLVPAVIICMGITQGADNILFQPFLFSRAARAHPLVILLVVLMAAQIAGIVGMLVAIPLATTVRVAVQQIMWSTKNYRALGRSW